ncbi:MAG TPA: hypothetical protein VFS21_27520 [Roseiflexaceae bacterium]|nr:hypothetical protein [Roseiflexaceae bacterium]
MRHNSSYKSAATQLLEFLASETWCRLFLGLEMNVSQGEETITDDNLLHMVRSNVKGLRVWKCPKHLERLKGVDWEWFIGSDKRGWWRYAVQAKKGNIKKGLRYDSLNHHIEAGARGVVGGEPQIDVLERYASGIQAIPLYCFYNSVIKLSSGWNCCRFRPDREQLGCTITPSWVVRKALSTWGGRDFKYIHKYGCSVPWRCLAACPNIIGQKTDFFLTGTDSGTDREADDVSERWAIEFGNTPKFARIPASVQDLLRIPSRDIEDFIPREIDNILYTLPEPYRAVGLLPGRMLILPLEDDEDVLF